MKRKGDPNLIIIISGSSGAGKTTTSRELSKILTTCGLDVNYREWELDLNDYFLMKYPLKLIRKLAPNLYTKNQKQLANGKKDCLERVPIKFRLWPYLIYFDRLAEFLYFRFFQSNKVTIIHRDHQALLITLLGYYGWGDKNTAYRFPFPKPDILLILDAPADKLIERRADYPSVKEAEYWRMVFAEMASRYNAPIIDSTCSLESVLQSCLRNIVTKKSLHEDLLLHALSDPYGMLDNIFLNKIEFGKLDYEYIIDEALKNEVGFQVFSKLLKFDIPLIWKRRIIKEIYEFNKKFDDTADTVRSIHWLFETNNIRYAVFKTIRPYRHVSKDIDVIVDNYEKAVKVLLDNGWKVDLKHVILKEIHLRKDGVVVDLHQEVSGLNVTDIVSSRRTVPYGSGEIYVPRPELEVFLILYDMAEDNILDLEDMHFIRGLINKDTLDWNMIFRMAYRQNFISKFKTVLAIIKLKDYFFYGESVAIRIPVIDGANISLEKIFSPAILLSSHINAKKKTRLLVGLFKRLINEPQQTLEAGVRKYLLGTR